MLVLKGKTTESDRQFFLEVRFEPCWTFLLILVDETQVHTQISLKILKYLKSCILKRVYANDISIFQSSNNTGPTYAFLWIRLNSNGVPRFSSKVHFKLSA